MNHLCRLCLKRPEKTQVMLSNQEFDVNRPKWLIKSKSRSSLVGFCFSHWRQAMLLTVGTFNSVPDEVVAAPPKDSKCSLKHPLESCHSHTGHSSHCRCIQLESQGLVGRKATERSTWVPFTQLLVSIEVNAYLGKLYNQYYYARNVSHNTCFQIKN